MGFIKPLDSAFLIQEQREHPMHVAGLQLYKPPAGASEDYLGEVHADLLSHDRISPMFSRRPQAPVGSVGQVWWSTDTDIDLEYHVRRSALPKPGRVRELLELAGQLHGTLLDRHRPLWEYHLIEGLTDGRFAVYSKTHHALADGVTMARKILDTFSVDPDVRGVPPLWAERPRTPRAAASVSTPLDTFRAAGQALREVAGLGPMLQQYGSAALREQTTVLPYSAPKTMLNVPITGARRVAAQSWDIARLLKVAKKQGVTLNDVVLAMCSGALRRYLVGSGALPERPLIAAVPVSMRAKDAAGEGNAITFVLCNLGTNLPNPYDRLEQITTSMRATKAVMAGRSSGQLAALGLLTAVGPSALTRLPGSGAMRPPYNLIISNVPGPRQRQFWNGAEVDGIYPLSIPTENQGLNITCFSYADHLEFGIVGCRRTVPHLQRLLDHLEESLAELES